jgi:hypothetical protein
LSVCSFPWSSCSLPPSLPPTRLSCCKYKIVYCTTHQEFWNKFSIQLWVCFFTRISLELSDHAFKIQTQTMLLLADCITFHHQYACFFQKFTNLLYITLYM